MVFDLLLSNPFLRIGLVIGLTALSAGGFYLKIRYDAAAAIEGEAALDALRRTEDAIRAGDAFRSDPERVRDLDKKYCRDC